VNGAKDVQKILIAEDEPALREVLAIWFGRSGYEVVTAEDGEEACELAAAERPDLVVLDLMLPRRDGYTVLFHLRGRDETRNTPVIFISAEPVKGHDEIARSLGAQGFLAKPFRLEDVLALARDAIARGAGGAAAGAGGGAS
jgi:two-component system response regulator MprA